MGFHFHFEKGNYIQTDRQTDTDETEIDETEVDLLIDIEGPAGPVQFNLFSFLALSV